MEMRPLLLHYVKLNSNPPVNGVLKPKLRSLSSKDGRRFNDLFYFNIFDVDQLME